MASARRANTFGPQGAKSVAIYRPWLPNRRDSEDMLEKLCDRKTKHKSSGDRPTTAAWLKCD
eukprot:4652554-Lingulodinium_polyedra.AAC.1